MNLAMTDQSFHICRPFFQTTKTYGAVVSEALWASAGGSRETARHGDSKVRAKDGRDFLGRSFLEPSFRPESFPFRPDRPDFWSFCFRGPFHGASAWCRPLDCFAKKEKEKRTCQDGSRYASQPVSLEWKDSFGNTKEATWYGMIYGFMDSDSEQWDTFEFWILDFQEKNGKLHNNVHPNCLVFTCILYLWNFLQVMRSGALRYGRDDPDAKTFSFAPVDSPAARILVTKFW